MTDRLAIDFGTSNSAAAIWTPEGIERIAVEPGAETLPLPAPPPSTLILPTAQLPIPLQRFRPRGELGDTGGPAIAFPPDGAICRDSPHGKWHGIPVFAAAR